MFVEEKVEGCGWEENGGGEETRRVDERWKKENKREEVRKETKRRKGG